MIKSETITVPEFKAKFLELLEDVRDGKKCLTITKRGKPYVDVLPHVSAKKPFRSIVGRTTDIAVHGDILAPVWADD